MTISSRLLTPRLRHLPRNLYPQYPQHSLSFSLLALNSLNTSSPVPAPVNLLPRPVRGRRLTLETAVAVDQGKSATSEVRVRRGKALSQIRGREDLCASEVGHGGLEEGFGLRVDARGDGL